MLVPGDVMMMASVWLAALTIDCRGDPNANRLYDDLLSNYNRLIRPVVNNSDKLEVKLGLKLTQLVDMNLKSQIMTTNLWVEQEWYDYKLSWDPDEYGGLEYIYVPSEHIWLPDIVLFNNADGNYEVTLMTMATLYNDGKVIWKPPAIYKSSCKIDVEFFPFDEQSCVMRFGSWTYDGLQVDLQHENQVPDSNIVPIGINLKEYYPSCEWDILAVPAQRNEEYLPCCPNQPYPDITFTITMRRKTLFYTVNLIIPCVGLSFLTVLVFYLPSDSGEKVSLVISILLSLTVFFLLLAEIIPPTSLAVPLLGKYLMFTMILVSFSITVTVGVLNVHYRSPATHKMSVWVRRVFIHTLPRLLFMRRPKYGPRDNYNDQGVKIRNGCNGRSSGEFREDPTYKMGDGHDDMLGQGSDYGSTSRQVRERKYSPEVQKAIEGVRFIAQHMRDEDKDLNTVEDWKYVAMVLDRMFLWIFAIACVVGTCGIIFQAPSLYDDRVSIDGLISEITRKI
uniref:Uncharacterized protein n=1 Tax=Strigamia maritima TaxID=126957 RepID=T1JAF9_STRMM